MSKKTLRSDEIDLIQVSKIIWNYKISIIIITSISIISGFLINYSKFTKQEFKISVPYSILYHPARIKEICASNFDCMNRQTSMEIIRSLNNGWSSDSRSQRLTLITTTPLKKEKYMDDFQVINKSLTSEILNTALNDISEIENAIETNSQNESIQYQVVYEDIIKTKRLIYSIINNQKTAIYFGELNITRIPIKKNPIIIFYLITGLIISVIYLIISNALTKQKKR